MKFGAAIPVLNEWTFMPAVVGQLLKAVDRCLILRGTRSLSGAEVELLKIPDFNFGSKVDIVEDAWSSEHETRNAGMDLLADCDYVFIVDSDEILSDEALKLIKFGCERTRQKALFCRFHTYWKTPEYRIEPFGGVVAPIAVRSDVRFVKLRMFDGMAGEQTMIDKPLVHHLSYVRTDEEMREKLRLFGHAAEIVPGWYERVWRGWDADQQMENLHPTHPEVYKRAARVDDRELLDILKSHA